MPSHVPALKHPYHYTCKHCLQTLYSYSLSVHIYTPQPNAYTITFLTCGCQAYSHALLMTTCSHVQHQHLHLSVPHYRSPLTTADCFISYVRTRLTYTVYQPQACQLTHALGLLNVHSGSQSSQHQSHSPFCWLLLAVPPTTNAPIVCSLTTTITTPIISISYNACLTALHFWCTSHT